MKARIAGSCFISVSISMPPGSPAVPTPAPLAGAELSQRFLDSPCQLAPHQVALGVRLGSRILHGIEEVARALFCLDDGRLFAAYTAAAQMVEADVGDNTVKP